MKNALILPIWLAVALVGKQAAASSETHSFLVAAQLMVTAEPAALGDAPDGVMGVSGIAYSM